MTPKAASNRHGKGNRPKKEFERCIFLLALLISFSVVALIPSWPEQGAALTRRIGTKQYAGFLVDYSNDTSNSVSDVVGFWKVPSIIGSQNTTIVTESVGIGLGNGIQIGTSQFSKDRTFHYRAWYTRDPEDSGGPVVISDLDGKVDPGRIIAAEIRKNRGDNWTLAMFVGQSQTGFADSFLVSVAHSGSQVTAEWLVAPIEGATLANFGSVTFLANATVNGITKRLNDLPNERLRLFDPLFNCNLIDTSDIDSSGMGFTATYVRSAPPCPGEGVPPAPPIPFGLLLAIGGVLVGGSAIAVVVFLFMTMRRKAPATATQLQQPPLTGPAAYCSNCGNSLQPSARFCDRCGAPRRV